MSQIDTSGVEGLIPGPENQPFEVRYLRPNYARIDICAGFNWSKIMDMAHDLRNVLYGDKLYLVVFRSRLKDGLGPQLYNELLTADDAALEEAKAFKDGEPSGLLCYFAGEPDEQNNCLSFCLWTSCQAALARMDSQHAVAQSFAQLVYDDFYIERHIISKPGPDEYVGFVEYHPLTSGISEN